jgi:hypothetical protein
MRAQRGFLSLLIAGALCAGCLGAVDTPQTVTPRPKAHHKAAAKKPQLPPLPSGPLGPIPQISLESMSAVAPQVTYQDGKLTIVSPNSTLADILRAVHRLTHAEMEIPPAATERVVTNLGPGPAPVVMAALLNGSHFNYVLLGSPSDANTLTRVVLVPKSGPETAATAAERAGAANGATAQPIAAGGAPAEPAEDAADETTDDNADQNAAEAEQPAATPAPAPENGAVRTPQQLLQEMQQRQLQMQQGQPGGQPQVPGAAIPPTQRPPGQPPDQP